MGRPPAYIFVVRHGKRLDAADKQWHLSSPTPYDPPLTYGGWLQSKIVGARIAQLVQESEAEDEAAAASASVAANATANDDSESAPPPPRKKRRFRVVLHSSPFLRCIQTSIAISAGIATNPSPASPFDGFSWRSPQTSPFASPVPGPSRPTSSGSAISINDSSGSSPAIDSVILRLDPFLGEWLSPEYFDHITPPPKSGLMLATAKAELLRRENYNEYPHFHTRPAAPSTSSQLWSASPVRGSPLISSMTPDTVVPDKLETLNMEEKPNGDTRHTRTRSASVDASANRGYVAPIPSYALSPSDPIPRGYVAHARDACVGIDYQWDSMRDDIAWGNGGVLPEEWAGMHQRFRRGLRRMVEWYATADNPGEMVTKTAAKPEADKALNGTKRQGEGSDHAGGDAEDDYEVDDIVVLVSHGAGCNALIGAITQQPVLADVAMSSITMAKRRPAFDNVDNDLGNKKGVSSLDEALPKPKTTMPEMYELKQFATTDHLHTMRTPPSVSRSSSIAGPSPRGRFNNNTGYSSALKEINFGAGYGGSSANSRSNSANASLGSMRRASGGPSLVIRPSPFNNNNNNNNSNNSNTNAGGITVGSGASNFSSTRPSRSGSWGLWTPKQEPEVLEEEPDLPMLDFSHEKEAKPKQEQAETRTHTDDKKTDAAPEPIPLLNSNHQEPTSGTAIHEEEHDGFDEGSVPHLWAGTGNGGLWGAPIPPGEAERLRDFSATKRRWTVNER
ncbi:hypothetical protein F4780DRAFT_619693 [Xylariomycetidae sp. FL0641]|nr:hypothetical protein F4780DRAFT_619693 [Xylariomycetidae sp. FL0641]